MITLTTFSDPYSSQVLDLDGRDFVLDFRFNSREACWYLSISTPDGTLLRAGIKLVPGIPLLSQHKADARMPQGELYIPIPADGGEPPGLLDLDPAKGGRQLELIYVTPEDLANLETLAAG